MGWTERMGRIGKSIGILVAVIVAQILIKGVLISINLLPWFLACSNCWVWWWLATGAGVNLRATKREELVAQIAKLRQEYLADQSRA